LILESAGIQRTSSSEYVQQQSPPQFLLSPDIVLPKVEEFLLPPKSSNPEDLEEYNMLPTTRLDELLLELAIGEHVRMCQYLYRDNEDECQVAQEVRQLSIDGPVRISSKQLTDSLIEGRSRAVALCRLCYGDDSIEYLRSIVDLASVYAMQGLWEQVSHHMTIASQKLISVTHSLQSSDLRSKSHDAALYTMTLFSVLRTHAIKHRGYITGSFLTEVYSGIESAVHSSLASKASQVKQEEYYNELLSAESTSPQQNDEDDLLTAGAGGGGGGKGRTGEVGLEDILHNNDQQQQQRQPQLPSSNHKTVATAICQEIEEFLIQYLGAKENWHQSLSQFSPPSWGQMIVFLTTHSTVVKKWTELIEKMILPQNKALLRMVFQLGVKQKSGGGRGKGRGRGDLCHPLELTHLLQQYPSVIKILSGTSLISNLQKIPLEVPLLLDGQTGDVLSYLTPELQSIFQPHPTGDRDSDGGGTSGGNGSGGGRPTSVTVKYELPITYIEFLSSVLFEWNTEGSLDGTVEYLRILILNLMSLCSVYSNQLSLAEENMKNALGRIEVLGLEMESIAVDVYNGISQLMIVKHKQWHAEKRERCVRNAKIYLQTTKAGQEMLIAEQKKIRSHYLEHKKIQLSAVSMSDMAMKTLLKRYAKQLMESEIDPTLPSLEAAYRYMIRTYEILEKSHGGGGTSGGEQTSIVIASASLAIASVQNIIGAYDESKEWLVRSIRLMEKIKPLPLRAIAFTQTQLSLILMKLRHTKSAEKVLAVAVDYYTNHVMKKLNRQTRLYHHQNSHQISSNLGSHTALPPPPLSSSGPGLSQGQNQSAMKGFLTMGGGLGMGIGMNLSPNVLQDIEVSLDLLKRLMILNGENGASWQAAEYAENMADLSEAAYGWDSQETAELRKQAGERQCRVKDWGRACGNFRKSLDAHQILFGEKDKRSLTVQKQLHVSSLSHTHSLSLPRSLTHLSV
jgi:hypothetical protein